MKLKKLKTNFLGKNIIHYSKIDSTQNEIWRLIPKKLPTGTLVIADIQTAGRGTHGRSWYSSKNNISFSFYIKTDSFSSSLFSFL